MRLPSPTRAPLFLLATLSFPHLHGAEPATLTDKTLVAWVAPANLTQRGGSVLTLDDNHDHFDAIVFGELSTAKWMAGSDFYRRTHREQAPWPAETATPTTWVQIAIVYQGRSVATYRNGILYSRHEITEPQTFPPDSVVVMGPRHLGNFERFAGKIDDARIYDTALDPTRLAQLQPNQPGAIPPWAWWTFDDPAARERTGRFPHVRLTPGAVVANGHLVLDGRSGLFAATTAAVADAAASRKNPLAPKRATPPADRVLNFHLMHPGGDSLPGDPNAAFHLDGTYHLHYILAHPWRDRRSFSFVHVTSPDMLHWTWQPTKLQPAFTGHGMFSGTGFLTPDGRPAAIYHGESSGRNQIAVATDRRLSAWEKPYPVEVLNADGTPAKMNHWDPDCFRVGDTWYAISGGENPPVFRSKDLRTWTFIGDFLRHDLPDVARGEDISCGNFFPIGNKWMLLCISHPLGCRYYIGDWDPKAEQFVPQRHGRMNWRRDDQAFFGTGPWRVDFFAPESLVTPDGRRVMWAWLATIDRNDHNMSDETIQSLPRELSLANDGSLRIRPLRELESLRVDPQSVADIELGDVLRELRPSVAPAGKKLATLPGESAEVRIVVARKEAERKLFGFTLFSGAKDDGLPILFRPETGTIRVGNTEAPFSVADLAPGEDLDLRIYVDRFLVEVFVNDRQALVASYRDHAGRLDLKGFTVGAPTRLKQVQVWRIKPTNQGFLEAQKNRIWEPATE